MKKFSFIIKNVGRGKRQVNNSTALVPRLDSVQQLEQLRLSLKSLYQAETVRHRKTYREDIFEQRTVYALEFLASLQGQDADPKVNQLLDEEWQRLVTLIVAEEDTYGINTGFHVASDRQKENLEEIISAQRPILKTLPQSSLDALGYYRGAGFRSINASLRSGSTPSSADTEKIKQLDLLFEQLPVLEKPLIVSRGLDISEAHLFGSSADELSTRYKPKSEILEKAYVSTAATMVHLTPSSSEGIYLLLAVPTGSKALFMKSAYSNDPDVEVVLPRGTRLDVQRVLKQPNGATNVYARVLPSNNQG